MHLHSSILQHVYGRVCHLDKGVILVSYRNIDPPRHNIPSIAVSVAQFKIISVICRDSAIVVKAGISRRLLMSSIGSPLVVGNDWRHQREKLRRRIFSENVGTWFEYMTEFAHPDSIDETIRVVNNATIALRKRVVCCGPYCYLKGIDFPAISELVTS